ncbi:MAG: HIT family protein [Proteobacteria bacterium]|nr:HIT family protein [Pseudomonadota bacterium]
MPPCVLCAATDPATTVLWQTPQLRVVRVLDAPDFPAFYRVIWQAHVAEFTDLTAAERSICMAAVATVEQALRTALAPTKINLASLGNVVPHLHWHVVARFDWDSHFPQPIWGSPQRAGDAARLAALKDDLPALDQRLAATLTQSTV